ncbi:MCE family protein [Gordonia sp. NPDC003425]
MRSGGTRRADRVRLGLTLVAVTLIASACGFSGASSLPVPGAQGTDNGSYQISAVIPTASGLTNNAPVMIDDVTVGSVGRVTVGPDWHANVPIRLNPGVKVPVGSYVMVGMTSVLGSTHLSIVPPPRPRQGYLRPGDQIPLPNCPEQDNIPPPAGAAPVADINSAQQVPQCAFPTTEQVLSALSVVLNGGGLSQLGDVTHELSEILGGNAKSIRALIPRLNTLVTNLNGQTDNIIAAMDGLNRLTGTLNEQAPTVEKALADGPQILGLLNDEREKFVATLVSLGKLSATTNDVLDANREDIKTIVANLNPALGGLAAAGPALPSSLRILLTFPFLEDTIPDIVKGDYVNSDLVLDLTVNKLKSSILMTSGLVSPEAVAGAPAGAAKRGLDPFTSPLVPGGAQTPPAQAGGR